MKKKIILLFLALMAMHVPVMSQSMTTDQLIQYLIAEKEKGTSQQTIVANLMRRGVTVDQLQKARKKLEQQQQQLGSKSTDTGIQKGQVSDSRLRTERQQLGNLQSDRQMESDRRKPKDEREQLLMEESANWGFEDQLDEDIETQEPVRKIFGHDIFSQKNLTFAPNQNMATPSNYRLGAGDVVIIDVWGASQETFQQTISPDGTVTIEGVGPIRLGGLSVNEATKRLRSQLGRYYSDCQVSLSLGENRSIIVQVMGEVVMPGTYTLSSLSSAFNALYAAGGISEVGTLRDIRVYRGGQVIAHIDVYDYLINGNSRGDVRLQDNDVIIVGPYDCLVDVRGKVKRPMFYEMKSSENVQRVLQFAGGFAGDAFTKNVRLVRKKGSEYSIHTIDEFEMNGFTLADGDSIFVDSVMPRFRNMVEVRGAVMHPGMFQMDGKIQSVRDLLMAAEGLREDAFMERAVMHREKDDLTLEMVSLDIEGIMEGRVPDVALRKNDVLFIPSKTDMNGERYLRISGEVNYPGTYQFADNTTIKDLILQAGGLTRAASTSKVDVFRRLYNPEARQISDALSQVFSFTLENGFIIEDSVFILQPYDEVQVRKSPVYAEQQNVRVQGCVNFEGQYAMTSREFRLSDLVKMAGGISSDGYSKGARLIRQMTEEERLQRENSLRTSQITLMEKGLEDEKFDYALADSIMGMKLDLGTEFNVGINLDEALAHPGGPSDVVLRANDRLVVPQYSGTVKISGEVMFPISINYKEGAGLSYYINSAGGTTDRASRKRTYAIYMNGSVDKLGRYASSKKIQPGTEIVVPTKPTKKGLSTAEIMMMGTSTVSISSMIISLINTLK